LDVVFVVRHLRVKDGWAWVRTVPSPLMDQIDVKIFQPFYGFARLRGRLSTFHVEKRETQIASMGQSTSKKSKPSKQLFPLTFFPIGHVGK